MWAQYIAAMAFMSGKLGIVHGISHAVSAYYDTHHGLNCGIILPWAWADAAAVKPEMMAKIAGLMGERVQGLSVNQAADLAPEAADRLLSDLESPSSFVDITPYTKSRMGEGIYADLGGVEVSGDPDDIDRIVKHIVDIGPHEFSARPMPEPRIRAMVTSAMLGAT